MVHEYNPSYFNGKDMLQMRPPAKAYRTYLLPDGTVIGLFQGTRGANPEIDFKLRMLLPGIERKPSLPPHIFWIVDLLQKIPQFPKEVREIVQYYIEFSEKCEPFSSRAERDGYKLQTVDFITSKYSHLEQRHSLPLMYTALVMELFSKNEKLTPSARMYRELLYMLRNYVDGKCHYTDVLTAAEPMQRRRR